MHEITCPKCGKTRAVPNVLRCPFCNKDLSDSTDDYSKKHISKCSYKLNPYQYSNRKVGRPKKEEYVKDDEE